VVVSVVIIWEIKGMIVGESAEPATRRAIEEHLVAQPEIKRVLRLITLQWGEKIVVAVQAEMAPTASPATLIGSINRIEASLQAAFPQALWVFFEPDVSK
jgi:divalent metal cation (Fe/Co/Zn/Cd) transporter